MSINPILKSIEKLRKVEKVRNKCVIHKYRRFSKKNKTFRTDIYFCADCGDRIKLEAIYGVKTRCWSCNSVFSFNLVNLPLKPICSKCGKDKPTLNSIPENENPLAFLEMGEKSESDKVIDRSELINQTLKELGLE